ncbi:hypothetical protein PVAP13_5KG233207 [Panicum virgatum]|uniref:Uncharacterized protein n=1 Tax=Panicum virgatum TaxID=38727 RepID=A0A8T0SEG3_PANVG|nr:hypothetical protein PVAP13_5KG233207 [Panicum virgatum]
MHAVTQYASLQRERLGVRRRRCPGARRRTPSTGAGAGSRSGSARRPPSTRTSPWRTSRPTAGTTTPPPPGTTSRPARRYRQKRRRPPRLLGAAVLRPRGARRRGRACGG